MSLTDLKVEWGGRMKDHLQAGNLDNLVKGIRLCNVRHNDDI